MNEWEALAACKMGNTHISTKYSLEKGHAAVKKQTNRKKFKLPASQFAYCSFPALFKPSLCRMMCAWVWHFHIHLLKEERSCVYLKPELKACAQNMIRQNDSLKQSFFYVHVYRG